jgi:uncharacterized protein (UPF0332 family)
MTGDQFIAVAGKIAATYSDPASCRTAIGRAYYGAFHLATVFLKGIGVVPPKNANTHTFVRHRFSNCSHEEAEIIGSLLYDLYADRLAADYDLDDQAVETIESARSRLNRWKDEPCSVAIRPSPGPLHRSDAFPRWRLQWPCGTLHGEPRSRSAKLGPGNRYAA